MNYSIKQTSYIGNGDHIRIIKLKYCSDSRIRLIHVRKLIANINLNVNFSPGYAAIQDFQDIGEANLFYLSLGSIS